LAIAEVVMFSSNSNLHVAYFIMEFRRMFYEIRTEISEVRAFALFEVW
jgi:hypothetical protein